MSRLKGNANEELAATFLTNNGYELIAKNYYSRYGEIDIIAKKLDVLHFVEVKSGVKFEPIYNLGQKKLEKILKTADVYMQANNYQGAYCVDALTVKNGTCEIIENVTL